MQDFKQANDAFVKAHPDDVKNVVQQIQNVQRDLWLLTGPGPDADTAKTDLQGLNRAYSALLQAATPRAAMTKALSEPSVEPEFSPKKVTSDWDSSVSAAAIQREIARRDSALGMLSYILAVVSGLNVLYFGKTFGTVGDYAGLILWGFGAKVTVDALAGAADRWVASQSGQ